jgi:N-acetylneuraminate synthase
VGKIFIIGEIGINHNGDVSIAKELIKGAKDAGCDAVKFQKRSITTVYSSEFLDSFRESPWGNKQRDQKEALEFGQDEYEQIDSYCKEIGIEWFASAWDLESQKFLKQFNLKYNKIASAMIVDRKLLMEVASEMKHTFISTGMSDEKYIKDAVEIFREVGCPFELMHCVSTYPMKDEYANLRRIETLRNNFQCDVGYSGHEVGLSVSYAAVALGITSLERHITLSRSMYGSDQAASLELDTLKRLVGGVRKLEQALGTGDIRMNSEEVPIADKLRAHITFEGYLK